jgi:hypothetical protein
MILLIFVGSLHSSLVALLDLLLGVNCLPLPTSRRILQGQGELVRICGTRSLLKPPSKTLLLPFVGTCDDVSLTDLLVDEPTVSRALTVKPTFPVRRGALLPLEFGHLEKPSKRCVGAFEKPWVEPPSFPFPCRVGNMLQRKEAKNPSRDRRWGDPALYPKRREY